MGRTVTDLAGEVDDALGRLAMAQGARAAAQQALDLCDDDVRKAMVDVETARDALFKEHPHLRGDVVPAQQEAPRTTDYEAVEIDDDNDPRFTSGAGTVSPVDTDPLPPVTWTEHAG